MASRWTLGRRAANNAGGPASNRKADSSNPSPSRWRPGSSNSRKPEASRSSNNAKPSASQHEGHAPRWRHPIQNARDARERLRKAGKKPPEKQTRWQYWFARPPLTVPPKVKGQPKGKAEAKPDRPERPAERPVKVEPIPWLTGDDAGIPANPPPPERKPEPQRPDDIEIDDQGWPITPSTERNQTIIGGHLVTAPDGNQFVIRSGLAPLHYGSTPGYSVEPVGGGRRNPGVSFTDGGSSMSTTNTGSTQDASTRDTRADTWEQWATAAESDIARLDTRKGELESEIAQMQAAAPEGEIANISRQLQELAHIDLTIQGRQGRAAAYRDLAQEAASRV